MLEGKTVLTGVKPTGTPHLGNYLGAIKPVITLGNQASKHYMFVADYHAINAEKDPVVLRQRLREVACVYLAFGMNPKHTIFYRQSDIPEIHEITTILYAYTPKGLMNKSHAYKACVDKNREAGRPDDDGINMGLYTYPTLMAADILTFNTDIVPVGKDQVQHVEIARDIANAFNAHYGKEILKMPAFHIEERAALVPGTDGRKMSKSYGNIIPLLEDDKTIKKAVSSVQTDSRPMEEPKDPESVLVYQIYKSIASPEQLDEMASGLLEGRLGYGHVKNMLLDAVINEVKEAREKYNYYMAHFEEVEEMLANGAARARPVAVETLKRLKDTVFGR